MRTLGMLGAALCAIAASCGGAADDPLLDSDGGSTSNDASTGDAISDGKSDGAQTCDVTCVTVPDGFRPVRLGGSSCPQSWTSTSVVSSPTAGDGTCTCACNVTQPPSCYGGDILRYGDQLTTATCTTQASTIQATQACTALGIAIELLYDHYQVDPPPPQGGTCEFDSTSDSTKVTTTSGMLCEPPSSCAGEICDGGGVCVAQDGDVACPTAFPTKTLVGTSVAAQCGACGGTCTPQTTCDGTLEFFSDSACTMDETDQTADGVCKDNPDLNAGPFYYSEFVPAPTTPTCQGTPTPPTATLQLNSPTTVCCK